MYKILKYSFFDLLRSKWTYVYFLFYLILGLALLFLNNDVTKAVITLMNVIVVLVPLIAIVFGIMYYYNSREFARLLLAQPIRRSSIFAGQFLGVAVSLTGSLVLGLGIPFLLYGLLESPAIWNFLILLVLGALLTLIFTAIAFWIGLRNNNKIKGFGYAIVLWLFMAVIYDGVFLLALIIFEEYPLDNFSILATLLNPVDLSRILILLKLDYSALFGYTGAVFKRFFGTNIGIAVSFFSLVFWIVTPGIFMLKRARRKDF